MKSAFALIAVAGIAGAANAQLIDVVVNGGQNVEFADEASATVVNVSLYLDRDGATGGFFDSFAGWSTFGGIFTADGGTFGAGTESAAETTGVNPFAPDGPDTWTFGRRPGGVAGLNNGSFRYPNASTNTQGYEGGSTMELAGGGNFEGFQAGASLGNNFPDAAERIEVFRATIDFTGVAAGTYSIDFLASSLAIGFGSLDAARSVVDGASVSGATVTIVPAPASAALLGLGGLAAARRRR
ncbi:MAG: PEP-CTERM sorting domain-containing protein [Planctomycetota bacterium]